jgi:hypothetical protein
MTWNCCIVRYKNGDFGLHEVYYKDGAVIAMTESPMIACGQHEGPAGIIKSLEMALKDAKERLILDDPF